MIYFDNAATTPELQNADNAPVPFGNPSSPHGLGLRAERAMNEARKKLAGILGCADKEIIFTSSGTESNNLAILGYVFANRRNDITIQAEPWEHPSVIEVLHFIQEQKLADVNIAPCGKWQKAPPNAKRLVTVSQVNHETGDINDIAALVSRIKNENPNAIIHVDGVQGFCKEPLDLTHVDMCTFSGHKAHAPAGVGGLAVKGVRIAPLLYGGGQEKGFRPGTENLEGIIKMSCAAEFLNQNQNANSAHVSAIKAELSGIQENLPGVHINALTSSISPYILNMSFAGIKGETLVHLLSEKGIYVSMGAACRSRKRVKSALEIMGFSTERAQSAVRFSFSHMNTLDEAIHVKKIIIESVSQLRRILGN